MLWPSRIVPVLFLAVAVAVAPATASEAPGGVAGLLQRSAAAWNRGDLDTFMRGYEDSPETTYVSSKTVIRGYAAIRAHYAAHYGKSGMGKLTFTDLSIRPLGEDYAVVVARWHLALASGAHPSGIFSLVVHHSAAGWHIVTDHSP